MAASVSRSGDVYLFGIDTEKGILAYTITPRPDLAATLLVQVGFISSHGIRFSIGFIARSRLKPVALHAVSSFDGGMEWVSASRFHPVNLLMGSFLVDVVVSAVGLLAGRLHLWRHLASLLGLGSRQSEWTLGPLKICDSGPVSIAGTTTRRRSQNFVRRCRSSIGCWPFHMPRTTARQLRLIEDTMPKASERRSFIRS